MTPDGDIVPIVLRVAPEDIALIKFVLESYEGVGVVRTIDRKAAVIVVLAVPDTVPTARAILASLDCDWHEVAVPSRLVDWLGDDLSWE